MTLPVCLNPDRRFMVIRAHQSEPGFDRESADGHRIEHVEKGIVQAGLGAALT